MLGILFMWHPLSKLKEWCQIVDPKLGFHSWRSRELPPLSRADHWVWREQHHWNHWAHREGKRGTCQFNSFILSSKTPTSLKRNHLLYFGSSCTHPPCFLLHNYQLCMSLFRNFTNYTAYFLCPMLPFIFFFPMNNPHVSPYFVICFILFASSNEE